VRAVCYLRVSSSEQTTDNQMPALENYCQVKGYEVADIYKEDASAWHNGHQGELSRLLDVVRSGRKHYDILLVWSLDRLSRQGPLAVLTLIDTFKSYGVKVESVQEPFTALPYGFDSVIYSFLAWVAKFESDRRSERTLAGLNRAIREGKRLSRPKGSKDKGKRKRTGYLLRYTDQTKVR